MTKIDEMINTNFQVDCSIVDIPYGNVSENGKERAKYAGQLRKIDKEEADIVTFDEVDLCSKLAKVTKNSVYIFCGINQVANIYDYFKKELKTDWMCRLCVWHKTNPSPSNGQHMFLSASEFIVFAKRRKTKFYGHCEHNVFNFPCGRSKIHPTEKPQELLTYLIKMSTDENDTVFDCCMGSGSTGVAALKLNRNFVGIELQEKWFKISEERLNNLVNYI
jgi:DNA modification methylase